jgi:predicted DNA-binding transcriptional regulator AlpA
MKKIYLSEVALSDLLEQIGVIVQKTVQDEMKRSISANTKKAQKTNYLTKQEVCAKFGISVSTLNRHVNGGLIDCLKLGRRNLYEYEQITKSLIKLNSRGGNYEY